MTTSPHLSSASLPPTRITSGRGWPPTFYSGRSKRQCACRRGLAAASSCSTPSASRCHEILPQSRLYCGPMRLQTPQVDAGRLRLLKAARNRRAPPRCARPGAQEEGDLYTTRSVAMGRGAAPAAPRAAPLPSCRFSSVCPFVAVAVARASKPARQPQRDKPGELVPDGGLFRTAKSQRA